MKKVTLATLKSFMRKNEGKLFLKVNQDFDVMSDCISPINDDLYRPTTSEYVLDRKVTYGKNWFTAIDNGIEVMNCCGTFQVVTK